MLRQTLLLAAAAALAGCETSARIAPVAGKDKPAPLQTQLAAFAANPDNHYPTDAKASDDLRAAAVIDRKANTIKIYNFMSDPITNAKVWVNGTHVYQISSIPAKQSKTLQRSLFYDKTGVSLASVNTPVTQVQLQTGDGALANLEGPVFESD
jgi:hypothetical protein